LSGGWILELGFGNFFTQSRKEERKAATSIWILGFGFWNFSTRSRKEERKAATAIGFWNLFFGISSIHDSRLTIHASRLTTAD
jgi:hypothetical protein